ncbi:MAG: guanylate kinase [bacterium]
MIEMPRRPLLLVVSAPSGAGKTTLCDRLLAEFDGIHYSVSCTTRAPREGDVDGRDYFFISEAEFRAKVAAGEFLEHADVHGAMYGTLRRFITDGFAAGKDVLMDIDVQGAAQIREQVRAARDGDPLKQAYVDIFIAPPSIDVLRKRLQSRGKDSDAVIERRVKQAELELSHWAEYQYLIVNDRLDVSYDTLRSVVLAERHKIFP